MVVAGLQHRVVQLHIIAQLLQGIAEGLGGGLAGAAGEAREGCVDHVGPGLHALEQGHIGKARGAVGVDDHRDIQAVLDGGDQVVALLRRHDAGHVLDADGLEAHLLHLAADLHILFQRVDGAGGVADGAGGDGPPLHRFLHGHLQVPQIIEGVEDADHVDAVGDAALHELAHHVVGIVLVAQQVLAPQEHLQLRVGHFRLDPAQPLPGILVQEAHAAVKGGAAPALHGIEARLVQGLQYGIHDAEGHPRGDEGLVGVPEDGFGKLYFLHAHVPLRWI